MYHGIDLNEALCLLKACRHDCGAENGLPAAAAHSEARRAVARRGAAQSINSVAAVAFVLLHTSKQLGDTCVSVSYSSSMYGGTTC